MKIAVKSADYYIICSIGILAQISQLVVLSNGIKFALLAAVGFVALLLLLQHRKLYVAPFLGWYGLFFLFLFLSLLYTVNTINPEYVLIRTGLALCMGLLVIQFMDSPDKFLGLLNGLITGALVGAATTLILQRDAIGASRLGLGVYGSQVEFSYVMAVGLYAVIWKLVYRKKGRLFQILLGLFFILAIGLSGSRRTFITPFLFFLLLYWMKRDIHLPRKIAVLVGCLILGAFALYLVLHNDTLYAVLGRRIESMLESLLGGGDVTDASIRERNIMISYGWQYFLERPLFGWGVHGFAYLFARSSYAGARLVYSHNGFTEVLSCYGLVGFFLYYRVFYTYIRHFGVIRRDRTGIAAFFMAFALMTLFTEWSTISFITIQAVVLLAAGLRVIKGKNFSFDWGDTP